MKKISIIVLMLLFIQIVTASSYLDYLTYSKLDGVQNFDSADWFIDTLRVDNFTAVVTNLDNATVTNYNVTGDLDVYGESYFYDDLNFLYAYGTYLDVSIVNTSSMNVDDIYTYSGTDIAFQNQTYFADGAIFTDCLYDEAMNCYNLSELNDTTQDESRYINRTGDVGGITGTKSGTFSTNTNGGSYCITEPGDEVIQLCNEMSGYNGMIIAKNLVGDSSIVFAETGGIYIYPGTGYLTGPNQIHADQVVSAGISMQSDFYLNSGGFNGLYMGGSNIELLGIGFDTMGNDIYTSANDRICIGSGVSCLIRLEGDDYNLNISSDDAADFNIHTNTTISRDLTVEGSVGNSTHRYSWEELNNTQDDSSIARDNSRLPTANIDWNDKNLYNAKYVGVDEGINFGSGDMYLNRTANNVLNFYGGVIDMSRNHLLQFTDQTGGATAILVKSTSGRNISLGKIGSASDLSMVLATDGLFMTNARSSGGWARPLMSLMNASGTAFEDEYFALWGYGSGGTFYYTGLGYAYNDMALKVTTTNTLDKANMVGINVPGTTRPSYPLHAMGDDGNGITAYFEHNISIGGLTFHSNTYDAKRLEREGKSSPLDWAEDPRKYTMENGKLNHSAMFSYTTHTVEKDIPTKTGRQVPAPDNMEEMVDEIIYVPTNVTEEGWDLEQEIMLLKHQIYELNKEIQSLKEER